MASAFVRFISAVLIACCSTALLAQPPRPRAPKKCEILFDPVFISQAYNPLSATDYVASFTARARRDSRDESANYSALLLRTVAGPPSAQLFVITDDGSGSGGNVLYERPGPTLRPGLDDAGEIDFRFVGTSAPTLIQTAEMQLRIPAGTEIAPGVARVELDVKYLCDYDKGNSDSGQNTRAFNVHFTVSGAVQASLTGTEPDFGEIGGLSDLGVAAAPPSRTQRSQYMRVASTGPYQVDVVSQNGWRMTATGAPTGNPTERIAYRYELLGQTLDSSRPNFTPVRCEASGVSGENIRLTATLTQGGQGKLPSPNYRDIITVTITPLAAITDPQRCD